MGSSWSRRWIIQLWPADAIVSSGWLMNVDFDQIPAGHKAHKQALADLLAALETQVPVAGLTPVSRSNEPSTRFQDMGWQ